MTETGLTVVRPSTLAEAKDLASTLAAARTSPEALQKSPADVLAIVLAGAELGLAPMQSIRALVLIKGKPTLSADAMGALVKSRRDVCTYLRLVSSDGAKATYETLRVGEPTPTTMSFSLDDAKQAGLAGGDNWRKFPAAMLRARALSAICRAVFPDLLLGVYDPDELAPQPERDVTPVQSGAAAVESVKRRLMQVPVLPAPAADDDPEVVGWGRLAEVKLSALNADQLTKLLSEDGEAKCREAVPASAERLLESYRAEAKRRLDVGPAPVAVTP